MTKTEIVWVYGNSGAGKETFVKTISEKKPVDVLERFGWAGKEIIPCKESVDWVVQAEDDGNKERRMNLPAIIGKLADKPNSVILIKGQDLDFNDHRPETVKIALPLCKHKIIFMNTDLEENYERLQKKRWWKNEWTLTTIKEWAQNQIEKLKKLQREFEIVTVNGNSKNNYECSPFPPALK